MNKLVLTGIIIGSAIILTMAILVIINQSRILSEQIKVDNLNDRISKCDCLEIMNKVYATDYKDLKSLSEEEYNKNPFCAMYCITGRIE